MKGRGGEVQIMIIAGEASGDLHAAGLLREFRRLKPQARFFGVAGERMVSEGCEAIFRVSDVAFLGFAEVIRHIPFLRRMMRSLLQECRRRKPQAIVLVDYPGFNLRFARRLRKNPALHSIPILYYISPQVWAWHPARVPQIAALVDRMAVIFDFELPIYQAAGLKADFVGHPLLEVVAPGSSPETFRQMLGISAQEPVLALLPGSRTQEIRRLFPLFLRAYKQLRMQFPRTKAVVGCAPTLDDGLYRHILANVNLKINDVVLLRNKTYDLLAHSSAALVASGTATLEAAVLGAPLVMVYRVSPLTYWIGRRLVKIPDIALVNVVAGQRIVPEFVQGEARPERIAAELADLLRNAARRREMMSALRKVKEKLGQPGASRRVAEILCGMLGQRGNDV